MSTAVVHGSSTRSSVDIFVVVEDAQCVELIITGMKIDT